MTRFFAMVDLGATNLRVALGDEGGIIRKVSEVTDGNSGASGISRQIIRVIRSITVSDPISIGIGSIGPLNLTKGRVVNTPNMPFKDIPIVEPLSEEFGVPVKILNDCCAAVLGEKAFGAGKGLENLVYVTFSTGLGGGAIVDGHLLTGKDGNAHEIGHLTIDPDSELVCGCGCRGHWEAYSSGANIPNYARMLIRSEEAKANFRSAIEKRDQGWESADSLFANATNRDPLALWVVSKIGAVNAIGFADIVNVYDPELITIGGSVALRNPKLILNPIREGIDKHLINRRPEILMTPLGEDAVLYGALALATGD